MSVDILTFNDQIWTPPSVAGKLVKMVRLPMVLTANIYLPYLTGFMVSLSSGEADLELRSWSNGHSFIPNRWHSLERNAATSKSLQIKLKSPTFASPSRNSRDFNAWSSTIYHIIHQYERANNLRDSLYGRCVNQDPAKKHKCNNAICKSLSFLSAKVYSTVNKRLCTYACWTKGTLRGL